MTKLEMTQTLRDYFNTIKDGIKKKLGEKG
jgi:hypothetical protein